MSISAGRTGLFSAVLLVGATSLGVGCNRPAAQGPGSTAGPGGSPAEASAPPAAATETGAAAPNVNANGVPKAVGPVATVNGRDIPAEKFNGEFERLVGRSTKVPADRMRRIAQNVLTRLIEQELREQAIRNENITLTDAEFDDAWREFTARFRKADGRFDEAALNAEIARAHGNLASMQAQVRAQRLAHKLVEKLGKVEISEPDLRGFYDMNPSAWVEAASRDVRPILLRVAPDATEAVKREVEDKALAAATALRKGQDFEQVAKQFSEGALPPMHLTRASAEPELEAAAFALKVGEVSKPIRTRWGWYVIRLIEKNEERTRAYNEVREEIRNQLQSRRSYTEERRILQELRKQAEVVEKLPF